ncbi:hypothetical protein NL676_038563 [Syzygium grande]|nr:hypothetical protein NL676_038563 [Syzygium grande]
MGSKAAASSTVAAGTVVTCRPRRRRQANPLRPVRPSRPPASRGNLSLSLPSQRRWDGRALLPFLPHRRPVAPQPVPLPKASHWRYPSGSATPLFLSLLSLFSRSPVTGSCPCRLVLPPPLYACAR